MSFLSCYLEGLALHGVNHWKRYPCYWCRRGMAQNRNRVKLGIARRIFYTEHCNQGLKWVIISIPIITYSKIPLGIPGAHKITRQKVETTDTALETTGIVTNFLRSRKTHNISLLIQGKEEGIGRPEVWDAQTEGCDLDPKYTTRSLSKLRELGLCLCFLWLYSLYYFPYPPFSKRQVSQS